MNGSGAILGLVRLKWRRGKDENHSEVSAANVGLGSTHTQCVYHAIYMIRNPEEDFYKPA